MTDSILNKIIIARIFGQLSICLVVECRFLLTFCTLRFEPRVMQILLVVFQRFAIGIRQRLATRLRENQLARSGIPLVCVCCADIVIHCTLGQQTELVRAPLFDNLKVGMLGAQLLDALERLGCLV